MAEKPEPKPGSSGRNPRDTGFGASSPTARQGTGSLEEYGLMEAVVERENMKSALRRVEANKGSAGVDGMPVESLRPYLKKQWPHIK